MNDRETKRKLDKLIIKISKDIKKHDIYFSEDGDYWNEPSKPDSMQEFRRVYIYFMAHHREANLKWDSFLVKIGLTAECFKPSNKAIELVEQCPEIIDLIEQKYLKVRKIALGNKRKSQEARGELTQKYNRRLIENLKEV